MIHSDELLIVVDPGHGGWDNGASWQGRLEKDDNLRLGLALRDELQKRGIRVLMTRDSDVYVSLADRVEKANEAGADLFVSLHRNSYIEQTPGAQGVENFIYLTAPMETSGRAARYVLDQIVDVGVQSNRGLQRGNFYVLRRTAMPAMLLEMGFIINEIDNQLFDEHLDDYAAAIARGVQQYFNLSYGENGSPAPSCPVCPPCPPPTTAPAEMVASAQRQVNRWFGIGMPVSGVFDEATQRTMIRLLQLALNHDFDVGLTADGILGPDTLAAFPNLFAGQQGNVVFVAQALLQMNGYPPQRLDAQFDLSTQSAVQSFQRAHGLNPDGIVGQATLKALVGQRQV